METNETLAKNLCDAIRHFAENGSAIDNFESYLSQHFDTWMKKFASTPCGLVSEFVNFATMYD